MIKPLNAPQELFDELDKEFHFTLDVHAIFSTAKCRNYYSPDQDGLALPWGNEICWCIPPRGQRQVGKWVQKASRESANGCTTVMLLPVITDTKWFHNYVYNKSNVEIRFLKKRLKFQGYKGTSNRSSMIVIFRPKHNSNIF